MQPRNKNTDKVRKKEKELECKKMQFIMQVIAIVIIELRKQNEKSQRLLAFENGIHKSLISRLESAKNKPMFFSIWKVAEAFNLKPSKLVKMIEDKLPKDFYLLDL